MKIKIIKESIFKDKRGYYWTSWNDKKIKKINFNHDKFSISKKNVLRGFHGDNKTWKLMSCVFGKIFFVVVNYDKNSANFLKSYKFKLDHTKNVQILIPPNFANALLCQSKYCVVHYKLSYKGKYFDVDKQFKIKWNSPIINVKWPIKRPILSARDKKC
jgi:dTDP-4-dehydrorhamnose 3,5-epimerase